jgi:hypothetical protein
MSECIIRILPFTKGGVNSRILGTPVPERAIFRQPKLFDWPLFKMRVERLPTPAAVTCLSLNKAPQWPRSAAGSNGRRFTSSSFGERTVTQSIGYHRAQELPTVTAHFLTLHGNTDATALEENKMGYARRPLRIR